MEQKFSSDVLEEFLKEIFSSQIDNDSEVEQIVGSILSISLAGIDTHGLNRVPVYIDALQKKRINSIPEIKVDKKGAIAFIDADNAMGHIAATQAIDIGKEIANDYGIAAVFVQHSNHFGAAYEYCRQAAEEQFATLIFTNAPKAVAPFGGADVFFGTNPISIGFPNKDFPIIVDLSTSAVARGRIVKAKDENKEIPLGWALDKHGEPTTDATAGLAGVLLPMAGPKGYALALAVEMLGAVFTNSALSPDVGYLYDENVSPCNVGSCFILISEKEPFFQSEINDRTENLLKAVKNVETVKGIDEVLIPGEDRYQERIKRCINGIPIHRSLLEQLDNLANDIGIKKLSLR